MNWSTGFLGELTLKIGSGITPSGGRSVYIDNGVSLIRSQNIYNLSFDFQGLAYINDEIAEQMSGVSVEQDDILLNITGDSVARCTIVNSEALPARVNQHVVIIRARKQALFPKYLQYYLVSPYMQKLMLSLAGAGGTRKALTKAMIEKFIIPLPSLPKQTRIAEILSAYDDLIENNRRQIKLLEESARLLYREWFVRLRFPGYEQLKIVDGVPDGWEKTKLSRLIDINSDSLKKTYSGLIKYVDISSVSTGSIDSTTEYQFDEAPSRARRKIKHGDIIWSCVRPNLRAYSMVYQPDDNLIVSTGFAVLRPKSIEMVEYIYCVTTTDDFITYLSNVATGTSYPAVTQDDFSNAVVLLPSSHLLRDFSRLTVNLFNNAASLKVMNQKLRVARDMLIPRLMSGELGD